MRKNFTNGYLPGAILIGADIHFVKFINANLLNANLMGANLNGADFTGADLRGIISTGCHGTPTGTPALGTLPVCGP